jgi:hypothetical protein
MEYWNDGIKEIGTPITYYRLILMFKRVFYRAKGAKI